MLSLYIHIPFCVGKCRYCGFYSTTYRVVAVDAFLKALDMEFRSHERLLRSRGVRTLYIGGGTPTVLSASQLSRLFDIIAARCGVAGAAEATVEANPGTITPEKLSLLSQRGVTRLSIGVQSFSNPVLATLGRPHTVEEAVAALREARSAGFRSIGIDLIYGIPGLTEQEWLRTLRSAIELEPEHLSVYALSLDEGSRLSRDAAAGKIAMPDDETAAEQYAAAVELLGRHGYERYEISNFALPGHACLHNRNYWERGEYLGLGPGAWSFIGERRKLSVADVDEYCSRLEAGLLLETFGEDLPPVQAAAEMLALGLRTAEGVDLERYALLAGRQAADAVGRTLAGLAATGLFRIEGSRVALTTKGMLLSNEAIARIMP